MPEHELRPLVVQIHYSVAAHAHELCLGLGIAAHISVKIQVVLCQVREHARVKADARHAVQHQRVGRDLHDDVGAARISHLTQQLLQLVGLGRRALRGQELVAYHVAVGADEADLGVHADLEDVL